MWQLLRRMTQRVSARVLFGRVDPEQADLLGGRIRDYIAKSFSAGAFFLRLNWPGLPYRGLVLSAERMERDLLAMVRERREAPETAKPDMLDRLIQARDDANGQMDDGDLVGQMAILFAASFETQTNALAWTLYLLAQHPEVMGDLHDELAATLAGRPPTARELGRLPLLDLVLKESLRILPPVPYNLRRVGEPSELGGFPVLPRYRVVCSPYITHHLPELYDEPERFDPLRWQTIKPGPYEYLPFSAGPRICIGATMSMATMTILLATLLQKWRLAIVPGSRIQRTFEFTMRPKYGLPMILHAQDREFAAADVRGNIHEMVDLSPRPILLKFPGRGAFQHRHRRAA
jgi:cytochrome P450